MNQFIRHFTQILEHANLQKSNPRRVAYHDADFGRNLGLSRLGIHYVVIPPHYRSSLPHAESHEEEFVFILAGAPQVWINGTLYQLVDQDVVGFPAGTGVAHTFINNTDEEVHMLVAGERTKFENQCAFPLNPEVKNETQIWWEDAPVQSMGSHDGRPQIISNTIEEVKMFKDRHQSICNLIEFPTQTSLPYPGDEETFCTARRLGKAVGLQKIGIWHETVAPGKRTSWPHAHRNKEEFVFVLQGAAEVWLHGHLLKLKKGDGVAFPAGTGLSHTIVNNESKDCELIVIGESGLENDQIYYPLHPQRNQDCRAHNWLWETAPQISLGPDPSELRKIETQTENEL